MQAFNRDKMSPVVRDTVRFPKGSQSAIPCCLQGRDRGTGPMTWATLKFVAPGIKDHNLAKERPPLFLQIQVELDWGAKGRAINYLACYSWVPETGRRGRSDRASRNVNTCTPQSQLGWSGRHPFPLVWHRCNPTHCFPCFASHSFLLPLATVCPIEAGISPKGSDLVRV